MARVIERHGHEVSASGQIAYRETPSTYAHAEALAGRRLDRRRNYAVIDGDVCESVEWSQQCSGCYGSGCDECGYKGRRRCGQWAPLTPNA